MKIVFIPANEKSIAHVFTWNEQGHHVATIPVIAWQMVPQGDGIFLARPVFATSVGRNARIGIASCWGVITDDAIYQDQAAFERTSIAMIRPE